MFARRGVDMWLFRMRGPVKGIFTVGTFDSFLLITVDMFFGLCRNHGTMPMGAKTVTML
jgi:hypothetical protein